jgi:hypothetical protein
MTTRKPDLKSLTAKADKLLARARHFSFVAFLLLVAVLYGFVLLRINSLSNLQPSPESVTSQVKAARVPHIDQSTVNQLESLQNNSVSVQTLFEEARSNPFLPQ